MTTILLRVVFKQHLYLVDIYTGIIAVLAPMESCFSNTWENKEFAKAISYVSVLKIRWMRKKKEKLSVLI
jgi:hypothetical protein